MFQRILFSFVIFLLCGYLLVQAQTPSSANDHYEHGAKRFQRGDLDGAIEDFTKAISISSHVDSNQLTRSNIASGANGLAPSDGEAREITVIDPFTANAYTSLGAARYKKGDIDGAIRDYDLALKINPGLAAAYLNRGTARYAKGNGDGALDDWNRALRINPRLYEAYNNRGTLRANLLDLDGALADFNQAIVLNPRLAEAYYHRGWMRRDKGDFEGAILDFNRAIELNPQMAWAYHGRGTALMSIDFKRARADFNRALELDPNLANAYMNRGLVLFLQGNEKAAEKDFERFRALRPDMKDELDRSVNLARELRAERH
jgi:tetratricopeptide (TPR) repeat protein